MGSSCREYSQRRVLARLALLTALAVSSARGAAAPPGDGATLWEQSLAVQRLRDLRCEVQLDTTTPSGDRIGLRLHVIGKLADDGVNRFLMGRVIGGGGALLGMSFLSVEHLKVPDDLWIFLPALGYPKRIGSSNLGDSFLGSNFTFGDLIQPEPDAYEVSVRERPENVGGESSWVIEARPRSASLERGTGVNREVRWLGQHDLLERRIEQYDRRGNLAKVTEVTRWTAYGKPKRWLALQREIHDVVRGGGSTVRFEEVQVDTRVPGDVFASARLAEGGW